MLVAARYIVENDHIPTPAQVGVYYKASDKPTGEPGTWSAQLPKKADNMTESKAKVTFPTFECLIRDLAKIIHYIFDL